MLVPRPSMRKPAELHGKLIAAIEPPVGGLPHGLLPYLGKEAIEFDTVGNVVGGDIDHAHEGAFVTATQRYQGAAWPVLSERIRGVNALSPELSQI